MLILHTWCSKLSSCRSPVRQLYIFFPSHRLHASAFSRCQPKLHLPGNDPEFPKDLVLFVSDNKRFFRLMNMFAVSQFVFWMYLGYNMTQLKSVEVTKESKDSKQLPWWRKFNIAYYKQSMALAAFLLGWGVLSFSVLHTLRAVQHVVLRKGGSSVTLATHTPLGGARYLTVPLEKVSAQSGRVGSMNSYIALKVKGRPLHYLIDTGGKFVRPSLFDKTVGVKRSL